MNNRFAVSSRGIRVPAGVRAVVDVRFDGERIWSINPERERTRLNRGWVRWPRDLEPYLDGVAEVSLVQHVSGESLLRSGSASARARSRSGWSTTTGTRWPSTRRGTSSACSRARTTR